MKYLLLFVVLPILPIIIPPSEVKNADDILGTFYTSDHDGQIEIYKKGTKYFGKIIQGMDIKKDIHNPDPALRSRSTLGIDILQDLEFDGLFNWVGKVYNPENGKTYKAKIWLESENNTLKLRGYVSIFYRTVDWERIS